MRKIVFVLSLIGLLGTSACTGSGGDRGASTQSRSPVTSPSVTSHASPGVDNTIPFGTPARLAAGDGAVTVTIAPPRATLLHLMTYDTNGRGRPVGRYVVITVTALGRDGSVNLDTDLGYTYQESNGTLREEADPGATYEQQNPLFDHPSKVSAGQRTGGQLFFKSADARGIFIVTPSIGVDELAPVRWTTSL